ncbi:MAG: GC-type dockerin domain-anchored protein, partial [Planctomycetota bacterium]
SVNALPGPSHPLDDHHGFRAIASGASLQTNGDVVFDVNWYQGGGLVLRSSDSTNTRLTFAEQQWSLSHNNAVLDVRYEGVGLLRTYIAGEGSHPQLDGPDAVGPNNSVATFWGSPSLGGDVLTLVSPDPCPADVNDDGQVSPNDFNAWINAYNSNSPACDQNGDGECRQNDFNAWILNFSAGC